MKPKTIYLKVTFPPPSGEFVPTHASPEVIQKALAEFGLTASVKAISEPKKPQIAVIIDGVLVQDVLVNQKSDLLVIDYDVEGNDGENVVEVPQRGGASPEPAFVRRGHAEVLRARVRELFALKDRADKETGSLLP